MIPTIIVLVIVVDIYIKYSLGLVRQRRNEIQQEVRGLKQQVHIGILVPEYLINIIGEGFPTDICCVFSAIQMMSEQYMCIINFIY